MRSPFAPKPQRSVSQLKQYERCPYSYYLDRIKKVWTRPAAWLPQGSAVHEVAEWWEERHRIPGLEEMLEMFDKFWKVEVESYLKITPNTDLWSQSGQYRGHRDIARRYKIGREQVEKYWRYYTQTAPEEVIWIAPDGKPGIELSFNMELDEVMVRGFIDAMISRPLPIPQHTEEGVITHELIVRDNKTGNHPGDDFQLAVYGVAVQDRYGVEPRIGDYWMARAGKPTLPFDLTKWPRARVEESFARLEAQLNAGNFQALPEPDKCKFCDVSASCEYKAG
jgi:putative RecB family exonuclease